MNVSYYKFYSRALGRNMEHKNYGNCGHAVLVFPSKGGRFYDFENNGMVDAVAPLLEKGCIRLVCVDGIDEETFLNIGGDPRRRLGRHERWVHYIIDELIPNVRRGNETFISMGCGMGGFHAMNFFFRRPDLFDTVLSLSGLYTDKVFFDGYVDDMVYANSVLDILKSRLSNHPCWEQYRQGRIICCAGQGEGEYDSLLSTRQLDSMLEKHDVPHWCDFWGYDVTHGWEWWRKQFVYFMDKIVEGKV